MAGEGLCFAISLAWLSQERVGMSDVVVLRVVLGAGLDSLDPPKSFRRHQAPLRSLPSYSPLLTSRG